MSLYMVHCICNQEREISMYNVITTDKKGNMVNKVEPEEKVIFYIGNLMTIPDICSIQAYDIVNSVDTFAWNRKDFYNLCGTLSQKVANYLDNL